MNTVDVVVTGRAKAMARVDAIKVGLRAVQHHVASESGQILRTAIKNEAPVRTGKIRAAVGYRSSTSGDNIKLRFHGSKKTHLVTKGTKAHDIWAGFYSGKSDKRFLSFGGGGAAHVSHPGTSPNDFPHRAFSASLGAIRELVRAAGASLMGR